LKKSVKIFFLSAVFYFLFAPLLAEVKAQPDSATIQYSLFSEYFKNKDYTSALPYGWKVLEIEPKKFAQWVYYKMEDLLWYLHDSTDIAVEEKSAIEDSIVNFYNMAIENYPTGKGYFQVRKAFVKETWLNAPADSVIKDYELAIQWDPEVSTYYYHRLGQLYKNNATDDNEYKSKALDLYSLLAEKEPDNPQWPSELESLVENIDQLVELTKKAWDFDRDNTSKAWKYASLAVKAGSHQEAIEALEFLVSKEPSNANYLNQLATAYQRTENLNKAEETFKKLISIEPGTKEHYLNLGILYKDKGQLSAARTQYQKASEVGGGWGLPIFYEGLLYEQAARGCTFDFETKMVYQLAVDTYKKARNMEPGLSQAVDRISALSSSIPTQEDYFFRGYKSGQTLPISGSCFGWIGRSITVP
jgi:tetratricopeptide (TPR) repeat protein